MENFENIQSVNQTLTDDSKSKTYLLEVSKWGKFLAIVGYIGIAVLAISIIILTVEFFITNSKSRSSYLGTFGVIYLALVILHYFPVKFLYKFSIQIKKGLESDNNQDITLGFENLKSLFKSLGILTIVILSIYPLLWVISFTIYLSYMN